MKDSFTQSAVLVISMQVRLQLRALVSYMQTGSAEQLAAMEGSGYLVEHWDMHSDVVEFQ